LPEDGGGEVAPALNAVTLSHPWVVKIDPASGKVVGRLDLSPITEEVRRMYPNIDYLNGIAYDTNSKAFLVTGKNWPKAFLIRIQKPAVPNP